MSWTSSPVDEVEEWTGPTHKHPGWGMKLATETSTFEGYP
jgi:hypothetical protein